MKFHDSPIILHKQMLEDELSAVGQSLVEFREAPRQEIRFRLIMTGERMRASMIQSTLSLHARKSSLHRLAQDP